MVLARLNTPLKGYSAASEHSISALLLLLQSELAPHVPQRGTVGASGDLTPLAHMVLCFQGKAGFIERGGDVLEPAEGLRKLGMAPLALGNRDGLALVNGTSAMTGIALCNARAVELVLSWQIALSALLAEILQARSEAWDPLFAELRPHPGQLAVTRELNERTVQSQRLTDIPLAAQRIATDSIGSVGRIGQDAYTLRCVPQVLGAVFDSIAYHNRVLETELNSVTDNPVFPDTTDVPALHGGNFMGQNIAQVSETLGSAVCVVAGLAERQIARLTDEKLNGELPAFLSRAEAGLSSGFMGAQVTATALLAEMRAIAGGGVHSISTNAANQDVVSMGTIAARFTRDRLKLCFQVQAILGLALAQAVDILAAKGETGFSPQAIKLHEWIRGTAPIMMDDRPLGAEIGALASKIARQSPHLV